MATGRFGNRRTWPCGSGTERGIARSVALAAPLPLTALGAGTPPRRRDLRRGFPLFNPGTASCPSGNFWITPPSTPAVSIRGAGRQANQAHALAGLLKRRQVDKVSRSCGGQLWNAMTVLEVDSSALRSSVAFTGR